MTRTLFLFFRKGGTSSKKDEYFGITNLVEHPAQLNPPGMAPFCSGFALKLSANCSERLVLGGVKQPRVARPREEKKSCKDQLESSGNRREIGKIETALVWEI